MRIGFMVRPMESIYFGPPASFPAGEAHRGTSQFPPSPLTFQGLVRTRLLQGAEPSLDLDDWSQAARNERAGLIGSPDALPPSWQLEGPYPVELLTPLEGEPRCRLWFPTPRFLLHARSGTPPEWAQVIHTPFEETDALADVAFLPTGAPATSTTEAMDGWVSSANLRWAFTGDGLWDTQAHASLPPFVSWESQAGVAIAPETGSAQHGLLYFLDALRLKFRTGFAAWLEGDFDPRLDSACLTRGVGRAGRGGRPVAFESLDGIDPDWLHLRAGHHLSARVPDGAQVWVALLTPAKLADPVHAVLPTTGRVRATILAAMVGSPFVLGGYSIANAEMRESNVYTPAGSAWLVELQGGSDEDRAATVHHWNGTHVLGPREESRFGFGQALVRLPTMASETG